MHDVFEGVCVYDIMFLLKILIDDMQLFSLNTLNSRIDTFNYGELEKSNKRPFLTNDSLNNKLKMSASEMLCFSRYLGLMISDLLPVNLPIWEIWKKLREIIDIIMISL